VLRRIDTRCVSCFCELPAAQELNRQTLLQLLQAAVQQGSNITFYNIESLCSIPAAQQLTSQDVLQLLEAAAQWGNVRGIKLLCKLSAAKQLSKEAAAGLLQTAQQVGGDLGRQCAAMLLDKLPGAE
jgi:hypothetical protein